MNDNLSDNVIKESHENTLDFQQIWNSFVTSWHWFLTSVIVFVLAAGAYLWFTPQKVNVRGKMQITDKSKQISQMSAGLSMLNALPMGLGMVVRQTPVVVVLQIGDRGDVEEALRTEEIAGVALAIPLDQANRLLQL